MDRTKLRVGDKGTLERTCDVPRNMIVPKGSTEFQVDVTAPGPSSGTIFTCLRSPVVSLLSGSFGRHVVLCRKVSLVGTNTSQRWQSPSWEMATCK
jgi:hypothetical protein